MPKALALGNGELLVCLDSSAQVRDLYFPYVGLENHVGGSRRHRIGIWVDGVMSWTYEPGWDITIDTLHNGFAGETVATNWSLKLQLLVSDVVYNERNLFFRTFVIRNLSEQPKNIKLFLGHEFELYESHAGDTAYFDPRAHAVIHYKGRRVVLTSVRMAGRPFTEFTIGMYGSPGHEGSFRDAEDGQLSGNPVEHGRVDSVLGYAIDVPAQGESKPLEYLLAAATSIQEASELHEYALRKGPPYLTWTSKHYWRAWVNKQNFSFYGLDERTTRLFKESLFFIRSHVDNRGSILASGDSDMLQQGHDTYAYMWPRDGAMVAMALDQAGYHAITRQFFSFCNDVITTEGYFMHKYRPDQSLGSSWHPWIRNGRPELPIQEDETALVLIALWRHYLETRDVEFIERIYNSLVKRVAEFMVGFTYQDSGLPYPSYDLWEEKYGISTFTTSAVYGALNVAGRFARLLGKIDAAQRYESAAQAMRKSLLSHLFDKKSGTFCKLMNVQNGEVQRDSVLDVSSFYGVYKFGVLGSSDPKVRSMRKALEELSATIPIGGMPRYADDENYRVDGAAPPNPWFISTLWMAQHDIALAEKPADLGRVTKVFSWVADHALPSGVLSEQLNARTGEQVSAAPLTWSHAEFVVTVLEYLRTLERLGVSETSHQVE